MNYAFNLPCIPHFLHKMSYAGNRSVFNVYSGQGNSMKDNRDLLKCTLCTVPLLTVLFLMTVSSVSAASNPGTSENGSFLECVQEALGDESNQNKLEVTPVSSLSGDFMPSDAKRVNSGEADSGREIQLVSASEPQKRPVVILPPSEPTSQRVEPVNRPIGTQPQVEDIYLPGLESGVSEPAQAKPNTALLSQPITGDSSQLHQPAAVQVMPLDQARQVPQYTRSLPAAGSESIIPSSPILAQRETPSFASEMAQRPEVGPFQVYEESEELSVITRRSVLLRTKHNLLRTAIVDPSVCDVVQFTPREISIIGRSLGATHVTFWFEDGTFEPVTFLVRTKPDPSMFDRREEEYKVLERQLAVMFPNSKVTLTLLANKLIIRGQARSSEEAAEILRIIRSDAKGRGLNGSGYGYDAGVAANMVGVEEGLNAKGELVIVNQLRIPGVHQVALRVKLAELNRSASDRMGVDVSLNFNGDKVLINSLMGAFIGGGLISYNSADVRVGLDFLKGNNVVRQVTESTITTMSGTPTSFIAGGEFPVPTTVGVSGASAVATEFRAYGTVISFLPVVMDKDLIRLNISAQFSDLDSENGNDVSGVPSLKTKSVVNTVQLREGQTFAIATTVEDRYQGSQSSNIPVPVLWGLLGNRSKSHSEREMIILVSPELVHPMEMDEVPPLPGFDVTEPSYGQFILGRIEGRPTLENRSTVWPTLRQRYTSGGSSMISGPYGH